MAPGLFLFGTTFLWMTAAMAGTTPPPTGAAWTLTNILCFAAVIGFTIAAWAVYKQYSWYDLDLTRIEDAVFVVGSSYTPAPERCSRLRG